MTTRFFEPGELGSIESATRQLAVYRHWAASIRPDTADNVSALASAYPHMTPGTVLALGSSGVRPEHPIAQAAAVAEAKRKNSSGFGWHSVGDLVSGAVSAVGHAGKAVGLEPAYDVAKGAS